MWLETSFGTFWHNFPPPVVVIFQRRKNVGTLYNFTFFGPTGWSRSFQIRHLSEACDLLLSSSSAVEN
jgi:hypothetical protein